MSQCHTVCYSDTPYTQQSVQWASYEVVHIMNIWDTYITALLRTDIECNIYQKLLCTHVCMPLSQYHITDIIEGI